MPSIFDQTTAEAELRLELTTFAIELSWLPPRCHCFPTCSCPADFDAARDELLGPPTWRA